MFRPCNTIHSSGGSVAKWLACWTQARKARVQIAVATLSGNSLRQTVYTHRASVHQAAKLVAAFLRVAGVTAGLAESNGSLPPGLRLTSPAGWLPRTGISCGTLRLVIEYGLPFYVWPLWANMTSSTNWIRYCIVVRGKPSNIHKQHAEKKLGKVWACAFWDKRSATDR